MQSAAHRARLAVRIATETFVFMTTKPFSDFSRSVVFAFNSTMLDNIKMFLFN